MLGPVWAVIPARLESTRLPRKLLRDDHGEPLIVSTALNAYRSGVFDCVIVLADHPEIRTACLRQFEGIDDGRTLSCLLRDGEYRNGTERVASLFRSEVGSMAREPRVVVGLQADEPEITASDFRRLVGAAAASPAVDCATLVAPLAPHNRENPNVVKARLGLDEMVVDFDRNIWRWSSNPPAFHHVGVYAWRPESLRWYASCSPPDSERQLNLEQLRVLFNGGRIRAVYTQQNWPGIDDEASYQQFCERFKARGQT